MSTAAPNPNAAEHPAPGVRAGDLAPRGDASADSTLRLAGSAWDVVVIGAGPAGAVTALRSARDGARVLLIDKATFPRPKVCGCCLSDAGVREIESVLRATQGSTASGGQEFQARFGGVPIRRMELSAGRTRVCLELRGVCLSRAALDSALVAEAARAGAVFVPGVSGRLGPRQEEHDREDVHIGGHLVRARCVVVADGLGGTTLVHRPEFHERIHKTSRFGAGVVLDGADLPDETASSPRPAPGVVAMWVGRAGYVGAARLEDGKLNLAAAFDAAFVRAQGGPGAAAMTILAECGAPEIAGARDAKWRGTPLLTRRRIPAGAGRVLIVGDAAGYVEPFTGEGMTWAVRGAVLAAGCVQRFLSASPSASARLLPGDEWARVHASCVAPGRRGCHVVAWALRHPGVTRLAARAAAGAPGIVRWLGGDPWKPRTMPPSDESQAATPAALAEYHAGDPPPRPAAPLPIGGRA